MAERLFASASDHGSYYEAVPLGVVVVICICFAWGLEVYEASSSRKTQSATGISHRDVIYASVLFNPFLCARPSRWQKWMTALAALLIDLQYILCTVST